MTTQTLPSEALEAVYVRIEKGIEWLRDNDPQSRFHLWFISGILPGTPLPAQEEGVADQYRRYHKNRTVFERLWHEMENREKVEGLTP